MPAKNTTRATTPHQNSSRPTSSPAWKFVDRWVRDPKIRRDTLIALGMILGAAVIVVLVGTALLAPLAIKILTGAAAGGGLGWGGYRLARSRRSRRLLSTSGVPRPRQAQRRDVGARAARSPDARSDDDSASLPAGQQSD